MGLMFDGGYAAVVSGFAELGASISGWRARWAFRRFVARPGVARLAVLVERVRAGEVQAVLDALAEGLMAAHALVFVEWGVPGLTADEVERVAGETPGHIGLRIEGRVPGCVVVLRSERGDAVFRTLSREVRRGVEEVRPWQRTGERCPRCDGTNLRHGKDTSTGREMRDVYCYDCRWSYCEDCGPSLASLLMEHARPDAVVVTPVAVQPERSGLVWVRLEVTDVMGFYDDSLGTYVADPDPARRSMHTWWFRAPGAWLVGGTLPPHRLVALYTHLYGEDWRYSRERSKYLILAAEVQVVSAAEEATRPWQEAKYVHVWVEGETFRSAPPTTLGSC